MASNNQFFFMVPCAVFALLVGCANKTPEVAVPPADCPAKLGGYVDGVAKAEYMVSCLGKPVHEEKAPDGYYAYLYDFGSAKVTFLFDATGTLVSKKGYSTPAK